MGVQQISTILRPGIHPSSMPFVNFSPVLYAANLLSHHSNHDFPIYTNPPHSLHTFRLLEQHFDLEDVDNSQYYVIEDKLRGQPSALWGWGRCFWRFTDSSRVWGILLPLAHFVPVSFKCNGCIIVAWWKVGVNTVRVKCGWANLFQSCVIVLSIVVVGGAHCPSTFSSIQVQMSVQ